MSDEIRPEFKAKSHAGGWVAQAFVDDRLVWESAQLRKTREEAIEWAKEAALAVWVAGITQADERQKLRAEEEFERQRQEAWVREQRQE